MAINIFDIIILNGRPVAGLLYGLMGVCVFVISYCVIGTHGMLSGTGLQALCLGFLTGSEKGWDFGGYLTGAQRGWSLWPIFLLPFALLGTALAIRIWRALPEAARKRR